MEKPTVFKPNIEDQLRVAAIIARSISKNKVVKISNGQIVNGQK